MNDQSRSTAWHILKWLQELYVDNVLIENVPEFRDWGPIGANGKPLKSKKGQTYRAFLEAVRSLGYVVEDRVLNAADYGDPTTRRRLFIVARRGNKSVAWPAPTHSRTGARTLFGKTEKWRAAREIIDWSIPGHSIFARKKPLSPKTMARILAGLERFGGKELEPFLVVLRNHADARSLDQPLPAITAGAQHFGLVEPFLMHVTHGTDVGRVHSLDNPAPTVTGAHRGELALCEPFVLQQQSGGVPRTVAEPLPTIATDGAQMLVEPFLVGYHSERGAEQKRVHGVDEPVPTLTTENRFAVVEPFLIPHFGERDTQAPRTHSIDNPVPTIAASGRIDVVQPFIVGTGGPARAGRPKSVDEPLDTVMTREHKALVEASFLASYYGAQNISPVSEPVPTVTTKDRFALVLPTVNGRALDIRLRMLKPHELARAMSFGDGYTFAGTQGDKVKQIGNAWPCRLGQALIHTILEPYATKRRPQTLEATA